MKIKGSVHTMIHGNYEDDFPVYLSGGLDQERSVQDYVSLVEHEISLFEEGEESDICNSEQLDYCKKYVIHYKTKEGLDAAS